MSWILVIYLLGAGGIFQDALSIDSILEINKKFYQKEDPTNGNLFEGDIVKSTAKKYSARLNLWPWVDDAVVIPYVLSDSYDESHRLVMYEAFKNLQEFTCIRFQERKNEQDYIFILPGNGCYSSIGRIGKKQVVSLAFECLQKGKGVVMHELMHVCGFWHEHSRMDRDDYVIIHWMAIVKEYRLNFCKHETPNLIVKYDYGSLLHYSSTAFSKSGETTIEAIHAAKYMGQRTNLSHSDIARVNKLYNCPQYVPSYDDNEDVPTSSSSSSSTCPEATQNDFESLSSPVSTKSLIAASLYLQENSSFSYPAEELTVSPFALYSSSSESKPGSYSTSLSSKESTSVPSGFMYSTQEPTHSITSLKMPNGSDTLDSLRRTAAPVSIQEDNSTVSLQPRDTEHPLIETPKGTAAPVSIQEYNQLADDSTAVFATIISVVNSKVNNSELNLPNSINISTIGEGSVTEEMLSTTIFMPKRTRPNVDIMEENATLQTSASSQSNEMHKATTTEDTWSSSGLGEVPHDQDNEHLKEHLLSIVRKRSLVGKTRTLHHPRWIRGNKLTYSYNNKRKNGSEITGHFCGFEHGFCGWEQSTEDDLDWRLSWGTLNVNAGRFRPEGFHLSLKSRQEEAVSGQKALLLRPIVQPSNCISFWYGSRHSIMGTLNVYITPSGGEQKLLWSSGGQNHVKWTKAQIVLPSPLLYNNAHVIVEGVVGQSGKSNIAIDDLYVGQCS